MRRIQASSATARRLVRIVGAFLFEFAFLVLRDAVEPRLVDVGDGVEQHLGRRRPRARRIHDDARLVPTRREPDDR